MDFFAMFEFVIAMFDKCNPDASAEERAASLREIGPFRLASGVRQALKEQGFKGRRLRQSTREAVEKLRCDISCASDDELLAFCRDSIGASQEAVGEGE